MNRMWSIPASNYLISHEVFNIENNLFLLPIEYIPQYVNVRCVIIN